MATQTKTEWKDIQIAQRELVRALEDNQLADALKAYDQLERKLEYLRSDIENTLVELQELLNG